MALRKMSLTSLAIVMVSVLLTNGPRGAEGGIMGIFGGGGGGGGRGGSGVAEILAAGLITRLLMENYGSGGGGGGQGRSMLGSLRHSIALAHHHHHPFEFTPAHSFVKLAFHPHAHHFHPHPAAMQLRPRYVLPSGFTPYAFEQPQFNTLLESASQEQHYGLLDLLSNEQLEEAATAAVPFFLANDDDHERMEIEHELEARADEPRPRYILPRIMRHFVQRLMRRGEQH